ncbi:hypothetical protein Vafri_6792 [Volvox africanus]|uniref:Tr-type G domain-containing protein n=1 Tax=Volvox africanus TaxID=51714 RepID=A0A8J4EYI8_9CHLO|nr:hypothetical protein Vafri_6792 [Volvox africanus]
MTEKLLLYGGAIHEAGEVKARRSSRSATSDWMELEKQRGISITSTALTFEYNGCQLNLLDTPGHQDFSEDTYRTLAAADNAVLLVDGAKGIEPQTRKLFAVARLRGLPVFTFVNKMDRPALNGFEIVEQLEKEFGLQVRHLWRTVYDISLTEIAPCALHNRLPPRSLRVCCDQGVVHSRPKLHSCCAVTLQSRGRALTPTLPTYCFTALCATTTVHIA